MGRKQKTRAHRTTEEQPNLPGYYFDSDKNRYFKIESNASASLSSQRSVQEKIILRDRSVALNSRSEKIAQANSYPLQFTKLLHYRSVNQSFYSYNRVASEILLRMHSRRVIYHFHRSVIQQSIYHPFSSRLMILTGLRGYSRLVSIKRNESGQFVETLHDSFLDGSVPSWIYGKKQSLVMTFLGSEAPIKLWDAKNEAMETIFPGQINHDIWSCSIDQNDNICLIGNGKLFRISRLSSHVSRSCQVHIRNEFGTSDALSMASFSRDLLITGHRNGYIGLFDSRVKKEVAMLKEKSSIASLKPFSPYDPDQSDYYFLSSNMNSEINLYDTRYLKVVQTFPGHVNTHQRLKCDIFNNNILISPGSDNFIRGWSLSTGTLLWQKLMSPAIHAAPCQLSLYKSLENTGFFTCQSDEVSFWSL